MPLIQLATPELNVYIPVTAQFKDLTHWRICAFKAEIPRLCHLIPSNLDVWFGKCYQDGAKFIEAPGIEGPFDEGRYRIESEELVTLQAILTTGGLPATYECTVAILKTFLALGIIEGTIVPDEGEGA